MRLHESMSMVAGPGAAAPLALAEGIAAGLAARGGELPSPPSPAAPPRAVVPGGRRRLWQVPHPHLCGLLGLALNSAELRQLAPRLGLAGGDEHALHVGVIRAAARNDAAGRRLNRHLERKFAPTLARFATLRGEDAVRAAWEEALAAGHVADGYFALLTHPDTGDALALAAREAVHMAMHAAAGELRRVRALLGVEREERARLVEERDEARAALARSREREAALQRAAAAADERATALVAARRRVAELEAQLGQARADQAREVERARRDAEQRAARAESAARAWKRLCLKSREAARQVAADEPAGTEAASPPVAERVDLAGLPLAYIGGRTRLAPRLKAVAERYNARLACHDGGLQEHPALLDAVIARAEVVLCPLDCVSHDAALRLKRHCKRCNKRVVWLPSSSLTTFARHLRRLACGTEQAS